MSNVTAATFRDPLLRVLGRMTGLQAGQVVESDDVLPLVYEESGIGENDHGTDSLDRPQVKAWILQCFNRKLKNEGLSDNTGRGKWILTVDGVKVAAILLGQPIPNPMDADEGELELEDLLDLSSETPETGAGVEPDDLDDFLDLVVPASEHEGGVGRAFDIGPMINTYHKDAYIRTLAMQSTDCMGKWSSRSSVCESCGLEGACKAQAMALLAEIAASMDNEDEQQKLRAAQPAQPAQPAPAPDPMADAVDGILGIIHENDKNKPPKITFTSKKLPARVRTVCGTCRSTIEMGGEGMFIKGSSDPQYNGMHHIDCWDSVLKGMSNV